MSTSSSVFDFLLCACAFSLKTNASIVVAYGFDPPHDCFRMNSPKLCRSANSLRAFAAVFCFIYLIDFFFFLRKYFARISLRVSSITSVDKSFGNVMAFFKLNDSGKEMVNNVSEGEANNVRAMSSGPDVCPVLTAACIPRWPRTLSRNLPPDVARKRLGVLRAAARTHH